MSRLLIVPKSWIENAMEVLSERIERTGINHHKRSDELINLAVSRTLFHRKVPSVDVLRKWSLGKHPKMSDKDCGVAIKRLMYVAGYKEGAMSNIPIEGGMWFPFRLSADLNATQDQWIRKNVLNIEEEYEMPVDEPYMLPEPPDSRYDVCIGEEYVSATLMRVIPVCVAVSTEGRKERSVICTSVTNHREHWTVPIHKWVDQFKLVSSLYVQVTLNKNVKVDCDITDIDWDDSIMRTRIPLSAFGYAMEFDDTCVGLSINLLDNDRTTGFSYGIYEFDGDHPIYIRNAIYDGIHYSISHVRITDAT